MNLLNVELLEREALRSVVVLGAFLVFSTYAICDIKLAGQVTVFTCLRSNIQ